MSLQQQLDSLMEAGQKGAARQLLVSSLPSLPQCLRMGLLYQHRLANLKKQCMMAKTASFELLKQKGNLLFKADKVQSALELYEQCLFMFVSLTLKRSRRKTNNTASASYAITEDESSESVPFKLVAYNNLAACYLRLKDYPSCIEVCNRALYLDDKNVKALFRKGKSLISQDGPSLEEYQKAVALLKKANELNSSEKEIQQELIKATQLYAQHKNKVQQPPPEKQVSETIFKITKDTIEIFTEKEGQSKEKSIVVPNNSQNIKECLENTIPSLLQNKSFSINISKENKNINFEFCCEAPPEKDPPPAPPAPPQQKIEEHPEYELSFEMDTNKEVPEEIQELGRFLKDKFERLVELNGQLEGKGQEEIMEQIRKVRAAQRQLTRISTLDFDRPKQSLKDVATLYNIDLQQPELKHQFQKVQQQNITDIRNWLDSIAHKSDFVPKWHQNKNKQEQQTLPLQNHQSTLMEEAQNKEDKTKEEKEKEEKEKQEKEKEKKEKAEKEAKEKEEKEKQEKEEKEKLEKQLKQEKVEKEEKKGEERGESRPAFQQMGNNYFINNNYYGHSEDNLIKRINRQVRENQQIIQEIKKKEEEIHQLRRSQEQLDAIQEPSNHYCNMLMVVLSVVLYVGSFLMQEMH